MLRALGVVFIIGCVFFVSLVGAGLGWLFMESGVLARITAPASPADSPPAATSAAQPQSAAHQPAVLPPQPHAASVLAPPLPKRSDILDDNVHQALFVPDETETNQADQVADWHLELPEGLVMPAGSNQRLFLLPSDKVNLVVMTRSDASDKFREWLSETIKSYQAIEVIDGPTSENSKRHKTRIRIKATVRGFQLGAVPERAVTIQAPQAAHSVIITERSRHLYSEQFDPVADDVAYKLYGGLVRLRLAVAGESTGYSALVFKDGSDGNFEFHSLVPIDSQQVLSERPNGTDLVVHVPTGVGRAKIAIVRHLPNDFAVSNAVLVQPGEISSSLIKQRTVSIKNATAVNGAYYVSTAGSDDTATVEIEFSGNVPGDTEYAVFVDGERLPRAVGLTGEDAESTPSLNVAIQPGRIRKLTAALLQGGVRLTDQESLPSIQAIYLQDGPQITDVDSRAFVQTLDEPNVVLTFTNANKLHQEAAETAGHYTFSPSIDPITVTPKYDFDSNSVTLELSGNPHPGPYSLIVKSNTGNSDSPNGLLDLAGNPLNKTATNPRGSNSRRIALVFVRAAETPTESRGITSTRAPQVEYTEYAEPRNVPLGFNPSDKVITRVARLYYFRDAHRVVQIVNRKARSYNRQAVDNKQQLADASRAQAEQATDKRLQLESKAVRAAQEARAFEEALNDQQRALMGYREQLAVVEGELERLNVDPEDDGTAAEPGSNAAAERRRLLRLFQSQRSDLQDRIAVTESKVGSLLGQVAAKRDQEIRATESWEAAEREERRAREEQFRREVSAKTEDPDTFAAGNPESEDPVAQVSLTVIGEGLVQMRGPRKGVNIVHTMINQIDAPVGQVRIAVHSIQVNGEHGDRMEPVVMRIQRYLDHSRFLTAQSAQMLRNAVVKVASLHAQQVDAYCPPGTPLAARQAKYREVFFGKDFIDELRDMDSEFLHSGNKLLSLHSMDTTSLSSALFLMALARNDIRQEILAEFMHSAECKLPADELEYFQASGAEFKFRHKKFQFLGHNARFVSLRGFFEAEVVGPNTLNPMQREFIRLAQIYKSRLITEIELRQRIMERSLIEERVGTGDVYRQYLREAHQREQAARQKLKSARVKASEQRLKLVATVNAIESQLTEIQKQAAWSQNASNQMYDQATQTVVEILETSIVGDAIKKVRPETDSAKPGDDPAAAADDDGSDGALRISRGTGLNANTLRETLKTAAFVDSTSRLPVKSEGAKIVQNLFATTMAEALQPRYGADEARNIAKLAVDQLIDNGKLIEFKLEGVGKLELNIGTGMLSGDGLSQLQGNLNILKQRQFAREYIDMLSQFEHTGTSKVAFENAKSLWKRAEEFQKDPSQVLIEVCYLARMWTEIQISSQEVVRESNHWLQQLSQLTIELASQNPDPSAINTRWTTLLNVARKALSNSSANQSRLKQLSEADEGFRELFNSLLEVQLALQQADDSRRPLDHKKFLDMLVDDVEEKYIELVEGTRAHTANIDNYLKRLTTALEDDFNAQFYHPAFRRVRETSYYWDVQVGQIQTESILTNNRMFAKVSPQATMEFDLPQRDILINEAFQSALAAYNDYGALVGDPNFLALAKMYGGQPPASTYGQGLPAPLVRNVLPGLPAESDERFLGQSSNNTPQIGSNLEALIPDPAIYKFETGTGFEVRPVIQPDGQAVVFHLNYLYRTNIREPVRADEKHLGRIRQHFIDTDVVSGNFELREVSRFQVALKASRTARGVPLLEDVPVAGWLFRPLPQQESSLQQNLILAQTVIYPTLFDLLGLRWAPAVADLNDLSLQEREFVTRNREKLLRQQVFDYSSLQVDDFMRIPEAERRGDLYRTQESIPYVHPNGYRGPGMDFQDSQLQEDYHPQHIYPDSMYIPGRTDSAPFIPMTPGSSYEHPVPSRPAEEKPQSSRRDPAFPSSGLEYGSRRYQTPSGTQLVPPPEPSARYVPHRQSTAPPPSAPVSSRRVMQTSYQQPATRAHSGRATASTQSQNQTAHRATTQAAQVRVGPAQARQPVQQEQKKSSKRWSLRRIFGH